MIRRKHFYHSTVVTHQKKRPIFWMPSNTKIPVGVRPSEYSHPSLPWNQQNAWLLLSGTLGPYCMYCNFRSSYNFTILNKTDNVHII